MYGCLVEILEARQNEEVKKQFKYSCRREEYYSESAYAFEIITRLYCCVNYIFEICTLYVMFRLSMKDMRGVMTLSRIIEIKYDKSIILYIVLLFLLTMLFLVYAESSFPGCVDFAGVDLSHYIGAARSLIKGDGYSFNGLPETLYPPGLSLSIAVITTIFGAKHIYFSRYISICSIIGLIIIFLYYRYRQIRYGILYCIIIACSPNYFFHSTRIGTDIVFTMSVMSFFYLFELANSRENEAYKKCIFITAGFFFLYAIANRSVGMALVAATGMSFFQALYNKRKSSVLEGLHYTKLVFFGIGIIFYLCWSYWTYINTTPLYENDFRESYFAQFFFINPHQPDLGKAALFDIFIRLYNNIPLQIAHMGEYVFNVNWIKPSWLSPLTIFFLFIIGMGVNHELHRPNPVIGWFFLFYMIIIIGWPYSEEIRFILVVMPVILIFLSEGICEYLKLFQQHYDKTRKIILITAILCLAGVSIQVAISNTYSKQDVAFILSWAVIIMYFIFPYSFWNRFLKFKHLPLCILLYVIYYVVSSSYLIMKDIDVRISQQMDNRLHIISEWVQKNTRETTILMSAYSAQIHFLSGRKTLPLPITGNDKILSDAIKKLRPDYLIINNRKMEYAYYKPPDDERFRILENSFRNGFKKEFEYNDMVVYRVLITL